jgi:branched-chain amino acid transport system permease protein
MVDPIISNAIIYGCIYAIMCVGLTLTYMTTKVPNFSHSNLVVFAIFSGATFFVFSGLKSPYETIPVAFLAGGALALVVYLLVLKPLVKRGANIVVLMIATFAVSIVLDAVVAGVFFTYIQQAYAKFLGDEGYYFYSLNPLNDVLPNGATSIFGVRPILVMAPVALAITTAAIGLLFRTKFGIAMRASIENPNLARVLGINVDRVYLVSWFIAGGLAGLGGTLFSIQAPSPPSTSSNIIVDIFAGVVLGGIGSIYGGIIGGFIIGFSETYVISVLTNFTDNYFGYTAGSIVAQFQKGVPLAIMIVSLLVIPKGLTSVDWRKLLKRFGG